MTLSIVEGEIRADRVGGAVYEPRVVAQRTAGDRAAAAVAPLVEALGVRVHQFAVDGRLCWDAELRRVEFWFLEFQFGIGRPGVPLPGYRPPTDLCDRFGPEVG